MAYYSSLRCGYNGSDWVSDGCSTDYDVSEVKYVVDAWALDKFSKSDLVEDVTGYSVRLITYDELIGNLGFELDDMQTSFVASAEHTPTWVYDADFNYWTMSVFDDSSSIWVVYAGRLNRSGLTYFYGGSNDNVIRPVVTLKKSAI